MKAKLTELMDENPLAAAGCFAAFGAVLGLVVGIALT